MKKSLKKPMTIISMILVFTMLFATSISVSAAEPVASGSVEISAIPRENSYPYPSVGNALITTTSWQTIASSTTGFNCNVYIHCYNTTTSGLGVVPCDVRMPDRNGNVVWSENGAIPGLGERTFWCGSDVYTIKIRTQAGKGTAYAYQA